MNEPLITFFSEGIEFQLDKPDFYCQWLGKLISHHNKIEGEISYVFCDDSYLLKLNQQHLNHDTFTDIITFDYTANGIISGDIFISIDRIKENAALFHVSFQEELQRVMAHGVLHLIGFNDKTDEQKKQMTEEENKALELIS